MIRKLVTLMGVSFGLGFITSIALPGLARQSSAQSIPAFMQPTLFVATCESPLFPYESGAFGVKSTGQGTPPGVTTIRVTVEWSYTAAPGQPLTTFHTIEDLGVGEDVELSNCGISSTLNIISAAITSACWLDDTTDGCIPGLPVTDQHLQLVGLPVNSCRAVPCSESSSFYNGTGCVIEDGDAFLTTPPVGEGERGRVTLRRKGVCQNCPNPITLVFNAYWIVDKGGTTTSHPACRDDIPSQ